MTITLEIPEEIGRQLEAAWNGDPTRRILEALAIEGYRQGTLSRRQVSEMLGLSFYETEGLLKERDAVPPCSMDEVDCGLRSLNTLAKP